MAVRGHGPRGPYPHGSGERNVEAGKQPEEGRMYWLIALVVVLVLGALAWWSSGRQRKGVDSGAFQRSRKIEEGRGSQYGGG